MGPKILSLDIETAPNMVDVWGLWQQNVGLNQIHKTGFIMSWCAKFLDDKKIHYADCRKRGEKDEKKIIKELVKLIEQADMVVAHNGDKFDLRWIRGRCLVHGLDPFAPVKQIDTLKVARGQFYLPSNRLEFIAKALGCSPKLKHGKFPGHEMWTECLRGNQAAWKEMEEYNRRDVVALEEVYLKLRPFIKNHPNVGGYGDNDTPVCPKCGGDHLHRRGFAYTTAGKYQRLQCRDCGAWSRETENLLAKEKRRKLLRNVM